MKNKFIAVLFLLFIASYSHSQNCLPVNDTMTSKVNSITLQPKYTFGLDLSYTDSITSWKCIYESGVKFVILKASEGRKTELKSDMDSYTWFIRNWGSAKSESDGNMIRGAYHLYLPRRSVADQVNYFLFSLREAGNLQKTDLPPVIDIEHDQTVFRNGKDTTLILFTQDDIDSVLSMLENIHDSTGRLPILYTARNAWENITLTSAQIQQLKKYPIWTAYFSINNFARIAGDSVTMSNHLPYWMDTSIKKPFYFWQFYEGPTGIMGINRKKNDKTDYDVFMGDYEELKRFVQEN